MEILCINLCASLLFVFFSRRLSLAEYTALCVRVKKTAGFFAVVLLFSSVLFAAPALAQDATAENSGLFSELISKGAEIFNGMREIIYVVAGFGIIGVSVGGFFGNLNWKWLGAIIIGLMVIGLTGSIIEYIGADTATAEKIGDTLK